MASSESQAQASAELAKPRPTAKVESVTHSNEPTSYRPKQAEGGLIVSWGRVLQIFIVPVVAIVIFVAILFFFVLRGVNDAFDTLADIDRTREQISTVNDTIGQLQTLSQQKDVIDQSLALVSNLAPAEQTEVVKFQQRIAELAARYNLRNLNSQTAEYSDNPSITGGTENPLLGIIEIPSSFSLQGKFADIQGFIAAIKTLDDFVIIGEMEIKVVGSVSPEQLTSSFLDWSLNITLIKYQFQQPDENNKLADAYAKVPPTVKIDTDVLEFINQKYPSQVSSLVTDTFGN